MKRFVEHFPSSSDSWSIENRINAYAEAKGLKIITIAPVYSDGIYVLFEESEVNNESTN